MWTIFTNSVPSCFWNSQDMLKAKYPTIKIPLPVLRLAELP
jgi:hypothetical protein